jgi:hypothetical protein
VNKETTAMTDQLSPAAQTALDAVTEPEQDEAADLCAQFGIPDEYARHVAAALAVCNPAAIS